MTKFGATGQAKRESQNHGDCSGPVKFGFNQSPGGTSDKTINVGTCGAALGLSNNTSYTILQISAVGE